MMMAAMFPFPVLCFCCVHPLKNHTPLEDDTVCLAMRQWGVKDGDNKGVEKVRRIVGDGGIPSL
jgi:hypothetical protein